MPTLRLITPCKVNLVLNILGRRADGFHELETLFLPVLIGDELSFEPAPKGVQLTCSDPALAADETNLVHLAAAAFFEVFPAAPHGVSIHLQKHLPMAAGLGGGSADAAFTLRGLNQMYGTPLPGDRLHELAARLGSDVPFFLQDQPAVASGRGEVVEPVPKSQALRGCGILLVHPGFGISTPWAYRQLAQYPQQVQGVPGRATAMAQALRAGGREEVAAHLYNTLEVPAFAKHPVLPVIKAFFQARGAAALMCGSGSCMFAITANLEAAQSLQEEYRLQFGAAGWTRTALL